LRKTGGQDQRAAGSGGQSSSYPHIAFPPF
jgi:hypothetical protein